MRVHQSITQSDLEKKRWPPMSMRLPLYSTDWARPPIARVASSTVTSRTPASASSQAAVRPAGPAPMINTRVRTVSLIRRSFVFGEQQQLARGEIEAEHHARRHHLGELVDQPEAVDAEIDDRLVEREAGDRQDHEQRELRARVSQAAVPEHPGHAQDRKSVV